MGTCLFPFFQAELKVNDFREEQKNVRRAVPVGRGPMNSLKSLTR